MHTADFDAVVIGAGHAGVEAALALCRMGRRTLVLTMSLDSVGMMPCNPAIGGTGKGHLVRELDAMGGQMGLSADATLIQMRMLNTGKGPAVHSLRAQMDKRRYHEHVKAALEKQDGLALFQGEAVDILTKNGRVSGVATAEGLTFSCRAVVVAAGVYLNSRILIGEWERSGGPCGLARSESLSGALLRLGLPLQRFKTGTPARVRRGSLDLDRMTVQPGDVPTPAFSFLNGRLDVAQEPCYLTYTNAETHRVILDNLGRSPMYSGRIHAAATRYCPSIEDKVVRFADRDRHQIFIEPEGRSTEEMYVQGMSTSLPADVQAEMLHTIAGLERAEIMRPGYAIEYDCLDPTVLGDTLMTRGVPGLFTAGQLNGSSGYEEAAAQGYYAGVNAALYLCGEEPFVLGRADGYLGVLVDDLVVKGTPEPYRMMTSRCEYRLLLRQDNADLRLTERARRTGLVSDVRYQKLVEKRELVEKTLQSLQQVAPPSEALAAFLAKKGESAPRTGVRLYDLLKRPSVTYTELLTLFDTLSPVPYDVAEQVDVTARYDGYIKKQEAEVQRMRALEDTPLPPDTDYAAIAGLRLEARQKLDRIRPSSIGQAARVSGVSPADISVLLIHLRREEGA